MMSNVTDQDERWVHVGQVIAERIDELGVTWAELERDSGISFKTWKAYISGQPVVRKDKRRALTDVLRWTPDSIDLILRGNEPYVVQRTEDGVLIVEAKTARNLRDPRVQMEKVLKRLQELEVEVSALREALTAERQQFALAAEGAEGRPSRETGPRVNRPRPPAEDGDHIED